MKKEKMILISIVLILTMLVISLSVCFILKNAKYKENNYNKTSNINDIIENEMVEKLKSETGADGDSEIYEVQTEYDGRKVLAIKANIQYKVAFAGMIKGSKPLYSELDEIIDKNIPKNMGIWVEHKSREKIEKILNENSYLSSKYYIDENGYIKIKDDKIQNDMDKELKKLINGNKQYIIDISSVCYIVDSITGEILDYNFEKMDKYQTYQYFQDEELMVIFINENTSKQLTIDEIFESVLNLVIE